MHYDLYGNVNRYGNKIELIILPFISLLSYGLITLIEYIPDTWNTGIKITEENKERVYTTLSHLISTLKFLLISLFSLIPITIVLNIKLSPIFISIVIFGDLIYWIYKLYKAR